MATERKAESEAEHLARVEDADANEMLELVRTALGSDVDMAAEVAVEAKRRVAAIEERRMKIVRPLMQAKHEVDDLLVPPRKKWEEIEKIAKDVIARERERAEAERRAALQSAANPAAVAKVGVAPAGVQVKRLKRVRVVNHTLVPGKYWIFDAQLALADSNRGVEIPGVEVYYETNVAVTGK